MSRHRRIALLTGASIEAIAARRSSASSSPPCSMVGNPGGDGWVRERFRGLEDDHGEWTVELGRKLARPLEFK